MWECSLASCLLGSGIGKEDKQPPPFASPLPPMARIRDGPSVMSIGELDMDLTSCRTQESRPYTYWTARVELSLFVGIAGEVA